MKISELIELVENKLSALEKARKASWESGDVSGVASADDQIAETQTTLVRLRSIETP